jgi:hypothetical protein
VTEKLPRKTPKILFEGAPIPVRVSERSAKVKSGTASDRALNKKMAHDVIAKPLTL